MYVPSHFRPADPAFAGELMRQHSFATLVSHAADGMIATHLPLVFDATRGEHGSLRGHVALPNPHASHIRDGAAMMAIFQGPHAYISPSWYRSDRLVPTWNYIAVHAYGTPRVLASDELIAHLRELVDIYEAGFPQPWSIDRLPADFTTALSRGVVGFEIALTRIDAKAKLSQNRSADDRAAAIAELLRTGDATSIATAALMQNVE